MFSLPTASFYGRKTIEEAPILKIQKAHLKKEKVVEKYPFRYLNKDTPSSAWKVFHKQKNALQHAKHRMNGVMTFVCQSGTSGERSFLVAHPKVFWFYDCRRESQRCSYEIIMENEPCKLYFDLEFSKELNPHHVGVRMTDTFMKVVAFFLQKEWKVICSREHVLDLDSSTENKFSRHLIYQLPGVIFKNNYHVGNFVKMICQFLRKLKNEKNLDNLASIGIKFDNLTELFVDNKGKEKLFCDEGVYTKNRHFRLYQSSKWNKKVPLIRSEENIYMCNENADSEILFLGSLITYFPDNVPYTILQYGDCPSISSMNVSSESIGIHVPVDKKASLYPDIDRFIEKLIAPGRIYRWYFSSLTNCLFYDIVGNRYCYNIGREHRSNNIRLVVDVKNRTFYQKCYDPDCKDYCSEPVILPSELWFVLDGPLPFPNEKENKLIWENNFSDVALSEVLDLIEINGISAN